MFNRRQMLKGALALIGVGSVVAGEQSKGAVRGIRADKPVKWKWVELPFRCSSSRTVQYGKADRDYSIGQKWLGYKHGWQGIPFHSDPYVVSVKCLKPIKKGQALIWHPDGTVTGGAHEKTT